MGRRILIGIAGGTASGKTLVAERLNEDLRSKKVRILKLDSYYRDLSHMPPDERRRQNFDHPDAFEMDLLRQHLKVLLEGGRVQVPVYDYARHIRKRNTVPAGGEQIFILEGILVLVDPFLRELMDIRVFIDADPDVRLMRRIRRDVKMRGRTIASILDQYEGTVRPMYMQFVDPSKRYADIIVPGGGHNEVAVDLLKVKIRSLLSGEDGIPARETALPAVAAPPARRARRRKR
ncbi:MAG: uridine kinase [Candidatus Eisenbacteria bacterium]|nr:uridine kinase [Candidatus Eisenbacteria bacterium]